jgi:superoxide dismutase, Cu-Zn family
MNTNRPFQGGIVLLAILVLWGCPPPEEEPADRPAEEEERWEPPEEERDREAQAEMVTTRGEIAGVVTFSGEAGERVAVQGVLHVPGLSSGPKGLHVHEEGACEAPDFESAGDHFDPHGDPHGGREDPPEQRHTGDFGNVEVGPDGRAEIDLVDQVIDLGEGDEGVLGRALVLHEEEDDLTTQPDGDAGDRVACGVIERTGLGDR